MREFKTNFEMKSGKSQSKQFQMKKTSAKYFN